MAVKESAFTLLLFFSACAAFAAPPTVEMGMLEFLGEFETSGGKPVDPDQFKEDKKESRRPETRERKSVQKDVKSDGKEKEDETTPHR